jgi:phosphoesterase RecJ-like protein
MQLLIKILPTLRSEFAGKVAYFQIKKELIKNKKLSVDLMEYILTLGRAIENIEVVVVFRENADQKNQVRVNFRSQGKVDVNKIARLFGGGGHKAASGCTIKGKIREVSRKVLSKIKENLL